MSISNLLSNNSYTIYCNTISSNTSSFNSVQTDSITSLTPNTDLSLSGNGTGNVHINDNLRVNNISSHTANTNLILSGNGTGIVQISDGIQLLTSGGTPTTLDYYETFSTTYAFTCRAGAAVKASVRFVRIGAMVSMYVDGISGTAGIGTPANTIETANNTIPSRFRPGTSFINVGSVNVSATIGGSAATRTGYCKIDNSGQIRVYNTPNIQNYDVSTAFSFERFVVNWITI